MHKYSKKYPKVFYWKYTFNYNWFIIPMVGIVINKKLKKHKKLKNLIKHETIHWNQYKKYTALIFIILYLVDILVNGYDWSLLEIEARQNENLFTQTFYTYSVRNFLADTPWNKNFRRGKKFKDPGKFLLDSIL